MHCPVKYSFVRARKQENGSKVLLSIERILACSLTMFFETYFVHRRTPALLTALLYENSSLLPNCAGAGPLSSRYNMLAACHVFDPGTLLSHFDGG